MNSRFFIFVMGILILWGCQTTVVKKPIPPSPPPESLIPNDSGKVKVVLKKENVRETPNGAKIGTIRKGEKVTVIRRIGNWVEFDSRTYVGGYIWAPSLGYPYINLYSATVYYDTTRKTFKSLAYIRSLFQQPGDTLQSTSKQLVLFFTNIGLGSHTETEIEVVKATNKIVRHGVTVFLDPQTQTIHKIKIDFYKPITGIQAALTKCNLPPRQPDTTTNSMVAWKPNSLLPGLSVQLERQEWQSHQFVAVIYSISNS